MTVSDLVSMSGYSRQRLNRLVDLGYARGIERKTNGRLVITDEVLAARWCEFLRRRKTERKRRNAEREEKRGRLKVRRLLSTELLPFIAGIAGKVCQEASASLVEALEQKLQSEGNGRFRDFAEEFVQTKSREITTSILQPIETHRAAFALRGRRPSTKMAREALFDFTLNPGAVPWLKSFSDIAREYGCTRAAVSLMSKQLPVELPERSGSIF
jgi:hypothetical protein